MLDRIDNSNTKYFGNMKKARGLLLYMFIFATAFKSSFGFWPFSESTSANIVSTPTLEFYPKPPEADRGSNLIYYELGHRASSQQHIESLKRFTSVYNGTNHSENAAVCGFDYFPSVSSFCVFNLQDLGRVCSARQDFGFPGKPCILLTLSKINDWAPSVFNESDVQQISDHKEKATFANMPADLRKYISELNPTERYMVWVSCNGETAADMEYIGPINYYPHRGFPAYYFPFRSIEGYQSPVVAIEFENPARAIAISIECKVWAKNIKLDRENGIGFVKFTLLID